MSQPLWATFASAQSPSKQKTISRCSDRISCAPVCARCLLFCDGFPPSLLFSQSQQSQFSQPFLVDVPNPFFFPVPSSSSWLYRNPVCPCLLYWGAPDWTQYTQCSLNSAKQRGKISLDGSTTIWYISDSLQFCVISNHAEGTLGSTTQIINEDGKRKWIQY